ncbi:MAG: GNAT family N-acetyltransferase [Spirochaetes bacterium]|nr:GNAT family N-acetyltransferase [Spirochaetota bacterium]
MSVPSNGRERNTAAGIMVRQMTAHDIAGFSTLFCDVFASPPWNERWDSAAVAETIGRTMKNSGFIGFTSMKAKWPVGFITGFRLAPIPHLSSVLYIDQLFVDGRVQGAGIGRMLMNTLLRAASEHAYRGALLLTMPKSAAESLYRSAGFRRMLRPVLLRGKGIYYMRLNRERYE